MGCKIAKLFGSWQNSGSTPSECEPEQKVYSWDKRDKVSMENYILNGRTDEEIGRMPGTVDGQQFIIQNCSNCDVYVFDHCATVTIDDCVNCRIFIGAIKSSIFIRDSTDCCIATACQQFRTRDCKKVKAFLCCTTQPIIEATTAIRFGCLNFSYPQMSDHLKAAGLNPYNNNWFRVHDFTPVPEEQNFAFCDHSDSASKYLPGPKLEPWSTVPLNTEEHIIPFTMGVQSRGEGESCLVAVFSHQQQEWSARRILAAFGPAVAIQTAEVSLSAIQARQVFGSDCDVEKALRGPILMIELQSESYIDCRDRVNTAVTENKLEREMVHISQDVESASREIESLDNLTDMKMSI